jgi:hypothetical protein
MEHTIDFKEEFGVTDGARTRDNQNHNLVRTLNKNSSLADFCRIFREFSPLKNQLLGETENRIFSRISAAIYSPLCENLSRPDTSAATPSPSGKTASSGRLDSSTIPRELSACTPAAGSSWIPSSPLRLFRNAWQFARTLHMGRPLPRSVRRTSLGKRLCGAAIDCLRWISYRGEIRSLTEK